MSLSSSHSSLLSVLLIEARAMASTGGMGAAFEGGAMDMPDVSMLLPDQLEQDIVEEETKEEKHAGKSAQ
eukprot:4131908-Amphidinium_carterae.1